MNIVIVDDDKLVAVSLKTILESTGSVNVLAMGSCGEKAIELYSRHRPDVLLMDEPTSALDPASTMKVEELMAELKKNYTVVIVTHNMQQAVRISDNTAFFLVGELVEFGTTDDVFGRPKDKRTEDYITGRFG